MSNNTQQKKQQQNTKKRTKGFRDTDTHRRGVTHRHQPPPMEKVDPNKAKWIGIKVLRFEFKFNVACNQVKANQRTIEQVRQDLILFVNMNRDKFSPMQIGLLGLELDHNFS